MMDRIIQFISVSSDILFLMKNDFDYSSNTTILVLYLVFVISYCVNNPEI